MWVWSRECTTKARKRLSVRDKIRARAASLLHPACLSTLKWSPTGCNRRSVSEPGLLLECGVVWCSVLLHIICQGQGSLAMIRLGCIVDGRKKGRVALAHTDILYQHNSRFLFICVQRLLFLLNLHFRTCSLELCVRSSPYFFSLAVHRTQYTPIHTLS